MKKLLMTVCAIVLSFFLTQAVHATLTDIVYDDCLDIYYLGDANYARTSDYVYATEGLMTWREAMDWADQLEYGGYGDWELASIAQLAHLYDFEGISTAAPGPFINIQDFYWSGDLYNPDTGSAWYLNFGDGTRGQGAGYCYAWAVRESETCTTPIPPAMLLLGSGLVGLGIFGRKMKRNQGII